MIIGDFQQYAGDENKLVNKTKEILETNKITLAPNDPFFRLEFALLTYDDVDKIQYAYKIESLFSSLWKIFVHSYPYIGLKIHLT